MNDGYVFIPALGLANCVGLILGFIYFDWYERHQRAWQIRLQETVQVAIAETLARPKPRKVVKPHRLYTPPKPASPCDCPRCRFAQIRQNATPAPPSADPAPMTAERDAELSALQSDLIPAYLWPFLRDDHVIPYPQIKSKRGAKKIYPTEGFACPHLDCVYRGITDQSIHALIHYGHHGKQEDIPDLMCQACKRKITSRIMTALYRLRTPSEKVSLILSSIVEGLSEEGAARIFSPKRDLPHLQSPTIRRWIARAAAHSTALHAILFNNLSIPVVQLDELRAVLRAPNIPINLAVPALPHKQSITWVWMAMCPINKIIPVLKVGPRTQDLAHHLLHDLALRLKPDSAPVFLSECVASPCGTASWRISTLLPPTSARVCPPSLLPLHLLRRLSFGRTTLIFSTPNPEQCRRTQNSRPPQTHSHRDRRHDWLSSRHPKAPPPSRLLRQNPDCTRGKD